MKTKQPIIQKSSVTAQIIDYMKENIRSGIWVQGEMIPSENVLTKELGVSRASIRTAIQQFIALGIMESHHGKGTLLKSTDLTVFSPPVSKLHYYSREDILRSLEYRIVLEPGIAALAAERRDEETLRSIEANLELMKQNVGNSDTFVKADMEFHREVARAAKNELLYHSLNEVLNQMMEYHQQLNELVGFSNGVYYHTIIFEALKERNSKKSASLMEKHLRDSMEDMLTQLDKPLQ